MTHYLDDIDDLERSVKFIQGWRLMRFLFTGSRELSDFWEDAERSYRDRLTVLYLERDLAALGVTA